MGSSSEKRVTRPAVLVAATLVVAAAAAVVLVRGPAETPAPGRLRADVLGASWVEIQHDMNAMGSMPGAPPHGSRRLQVELDIANTGGTDITVPLRALTLRSARGRDVPLSGGSAVPVTLTAGQHLAATVTFDVPRDDRAEMRLRWPAGVGRRELPLTPDAGSDR